MNIVILNGSITPSPLDDYLARLVAEIRHGGHTTTVFDLRTLSLPRCTGCFGCWLKTPGQCVSKDASHDISKAAINAEHLVWASPVKMGFTSSLLKTALDKLIQILHPYVDIVDGEVHHQKRYDKYPTWGLLLEAGTDTDTEDLKIIEHIYRRAAINFKTTLQWMKTTNATAEEVIYEID